MDNKKIGYVNSENNIDKYIEEVVQNADSDNIAFVNLENTLDLKLQLVDRNIDEQEDNIKEKIEENLSIQYTTYAIAINGENKVYVSNNEEAQNIVDEIKESYNEKYTEDLSIIQVYSEDYSEIEAIDTENAKEKISNEVNEIKKESERKVKLASTKKKTTTINKSDNVNGIKFTVKPVSGTITSRFGYRTSPGGIGSTNHKGIDICAQKGTEIKAAAGGTVKFSATKGELGKLVIIDHGNGVQTYYGHCNELKVSAGEQVNAGDIIATVGRTGTATGNHLHFEVHVNGTAVNPQKYIY